MIVLPLQPFFVWAMVFLRMACILTMFPLFGEKFIALRVRILLAAAIAIALTPVVPVQAEMFPLSLNGIIRLVMAEVLLGFGLALIGRILFAIVQFAGQLVGEQMGFGIVNSIDPTGSHQIAVVAELMYILSILLFLTWDMHHILLGVAAESFRVLPPGGAGINAGVSDFMVRLGTVLFSLSLQLAMPIIIIIFAINVALGLITRGVPQINVFMESFPLRIIAGLAMLMFTLTFTISLWENMFGEMQGMMTDLIRLMKG